MQRTPRASEEFARTFCRQMERNIVKKTVDRVAYLRSVCANRVVLHIGCAGAGLTSTKLKDGSLMHLSLASVTRELHGIDIDAESIELMRRHGVPSLFVGDCERLDDIELPGNLDVVLIANVMNFLAAPGTVLKGAKRLLKPSGELVLTTDNSYSLKRFLTYWLLRVDLGHSSSLWHASPSSLGQMLRRFGYTPTEMYGFWAGADIFARQTLRNRMSNYILSRLPLSAGCADGLIVRAQLATTTS